MPPPMSFEIRSREGRARTGTLRLHHGEVRTPAFVPLATKAVVKDIFDKGKGALVITEFTTYDEAGDELIKNQVTTFVRGAGGWGGDRGPSADVNVPPDRKPDVVIEERTSENQALLYRLSGDWNPLHADPGFAKAFGLERGSAREELIEQHAE